MIDVLKQRKFGLWRNNSRFWKVKVNSLPSLVVNWELAKKIVINWYLASKFVVNWELGTAISTLLSRSTIPDPETSSWFSKTHPTVADSKNKSIIHGSLKDFRLLSLFLHPLPPRDVMEKLQEPGGMFQDHFYACLLLLVWRTVWTRLYAGTKFSSPVYSQKMTCIMLHSSF